jgi:ABC-2 type transport system ATP-binding protein
MIEIRRLILRLSSLGKTIFLSSHILHEVQQVCNRVAILQKGNLVKQGNVNELLKADEQVEVRLNSIDETQYAVHILQSAREQGASWLTNIETATNSRSQPILIIETAASRSAEVNAILAQHRLFAAEIHPREGSLEELYLEVTSPSSQMSHAGMEALAGTPVASIPPAEPAREEREIR